MVIIALFVLVIVIALILNNIFLSKKVEVLYMENQLLKEVIQQGITMSKIVKSGMYETEMEKLFDTTLKPQHPSVINEYSIVDSRGKVIYMINPQVNNFRGLLNAIDNMDLREFHYHIGENSPFDNRIMYDRWFEKLMDEKWQIDNRERLEGIKGVNLVLRSEQYHIMCLINEKMAFTVVNLLHLHIFKQPILEEKIVGRNLLLCKPFTGFHSFITAILWIIGCFKKTEFGELISCSPSKT